MVGLARAVSLNDSAIVQTYHSHPQRSLSGPDHSPSSLLSTQNITTIPETPNASIADQTMPLDDTLSQSSEASPSVDVTWPASPNLQPPNFSWGSCCGEVFCTRINSAYEEVVHWRRNLFQVPSGSAGKAFVSELARLFQAYADSSSLECIAMKATTAMLILLLQKPSRTSKSKDHSTHLQRRMELWLDGDIQALLDEGKCIQKRLGNTATSPSSSDAIARIFRDLMLRAKFKLH